MKSHGRSDGRRRDVRLGVREGPDGRRPAPAADSGTAFISVNNLDKPNVLPVARQLAGLGFKLVATRGHGRLPSRARPRGRHHLQGQRRPPARRRRAAQSPDRARHQHAARPRVVLRRPHGPKRRDAAGRPLHHDPHRRRRRRQRDRGAQDGRTGGQVTAGISPGADQNLESEGSGVPVRGSDVPIRSGVRRDSRFRSAWVPTVRSMLALA